MNLKNLKKPTEQDEKFYSALDEMNEVIVALYRIHPSRDKIIRVVNEQREAYKKELETFIAPTSGGNP